MDDIDGLMRRLRELPLDPRLSTIDSAIFDGIERAQRPALSGGGLTMVALASLSLGLAGTLVPASSSTAAPISVLGSPSALAPSTLLGAGDE